MKFVFFFILIVLYKLSRNIFSLIQTKRYKNIYLKWIDDPSSPIELYSMQMLKLLKNAGVPDADVRITVKIASNYARSQIVSAYNNLTTYNKVFFL